VQKRVLPALEESKYCSSISIATKTGTPTLGGKIIKIYDNYEDALLRFDGEIVYISLINGLHDKYIRLAAKFGFNCIVDKPAILMQESLDYIKFFSKKQIFAEAIVFHEHPAWEEMISEIGGNNLINNVIGIFKIPNLSLNDYRMNMKLGGGAIYDMSPYAMGIGRRLWNISPISLSASHMMDENFVVTGFHIVADYGLGRVSIGTFGFGEEYQNRVILSGMNGSAECDRIFSAPKDLKIRIFGNKKNIMWQKLLTEADAFQIFLDKVLKDVKNKEIGIWFSELENSFQDTQMLLRNTSRLG
jgi:predicted dehydrogenase